MCEEGVEAAVILRPCVCVLVRAPYPLHRGSKVGGHDLSDPCRSRDHQSTGGLMDEQRGTHQADLAQWLQMRSHG